MVCRRADLVCWGQEGSEKRKTGLAGEERQLARMREEKEEESTIV